MPESRPRRDAATTAISIGLIALAIFIFLQTREIDADGGYSAVGPRFTPLVVAAGLLLVGLGLLREALAGGWEGVEPPGEPMHAPAFLWITGGLVVHMALIGFIGFTLASTLLFFAVARGFGSERPVRDLAIGFGLAIVVYLFFTHILGLALPASPLKIL